MPGAMTRQRKMQSLGEGRRRRGMNRRPGVFFAPTAKCSIASARAHS